MLDEHDDFELFDLAKGASPAAQEWIQNGVLRLTPDAGTDGFIAQGYEEGLRGPRMETGVGHGCAVPNPRGMAAGFGTARPCPTSRGDHDLLDRGGSRTPVVADLDPPFPLGFLLE